MKTSQTQEIKKNNTTTDIVDDRFYRQCKDNTKKDLMKRNPVMYFIVIAISIIICFIILGTSDFREDERGFSFVMASAVMLFITYVTIFWNSQLSDTERICRYMMEKKKELSLEVSLRNYRISQGEFCLSKTAVTKKNKKDNLKIQKLEFWIKRLES